MSVAYPSIQVSFSSQPESVSITASWTSACVLADVVILDTCSATIGDSCSIYAGLGTPTLMLSGYIDSIEVDSVSGKTRVRCRDVMMRAVEYYLVPLADGTAEYVTQGLDAGQEIAALLAIPGLSVASTATLGFTIEEGFGFMLTSVWDAVFSIANLGNWRVYADASGDVYVTDNQVEYPGASVATLYDTQDITRMSMQYSLGDIINRVVVAGAEGIYVVRSTEGLLPWWKTAVISRHWISTEELATDIADLNLSLYSSVKPVVRGRIIGHETLNVGDGVTIVENSPEPIGAAGNWVIYSISKHIGPDGAYCDVVLRQ